MPRSVAEANNPSLQIAWVNKLFGWTNQTFSTHKEQSQIVPPTNRQTNKYENCYRQDGTANRYHTQEKDLKIIYYRSPTPCAPDTIECSAAIAKSGLFLQHPFLTFVVSLHVAANRTVVLTPCKLGWAMLMLVGQAIGDHLRRVPPLSYRYFPLARSDRAPVVVTGRDHTERGLLLHPRHL